MGGGGGGGGLLTVGGTVLCMNINDVSPGRYYR